MTDITVLPVEYRDQHGFTTRVAYLATGRITIDLGTRLHQSLDEGRFFVPAQLGLPHAAWLTPNWPDQPGPFDSPWHELLVADVYDDDLKHFRRSTDMPLALLVGGIEAFVDQMTRLQGQWDDDFWDENYRPELVPEPAAPLNLNPFGPVSPVSPVSPIAPLSVQRTHS